ncbi:MAG TPA: hypothetical protein VFV67_23215, partial [Actinophytocola sp.]|nr:hypothetical protein [Actinophytocola sp.]
MTESPEKAVIHLACLLDAPTPALTDWAALTAPQIALHPLPPDAPNPPGPAPYALLATGPLAPAAFDLATAWSTAAHAPTRLVVCDSPPPPAAAPLPCPIIAFASPTLATEMSAWRPLTTN